MNKLGDFLTGTKIFEEVESPTNGKITVLKSLAFGTHFQVGGLTQSGGVVYEVWKTTLQKVRSLPAGKAGQKFQIKNCLILGLGGGSAALLVRRFWPTTEITGVDIDPVMIALGKKYLNLEGTKAKAIEADALEFCEQEATKGERYGLILIDIYVGDTVPQKFETDDFPKVILKLLADGGVVVFNRLYYGEKRPEAVKFGKKLEEVFSTVSRVFPEANVMFVCSK